ncbi:MAG: hypothetical protein U0136_16345 [Bdellovibrionota bacterium]
MTSVTTTKKWVRSTTGANGTDVGCFEVTDDGGIQVYEFGGCSRRATEDEAAEIRAQHGTDHVATAPPAVDDWSIEPISTY